MNVRSSILRLSILLIIFLGFVNPREATFAQTDETGQIIVSPSTGLETTENGGTAAFTIVLDENRPPSSGVKIGIESTNDSEGSIKGPDSQTFVEFRTDNWKTPQTVIVTGLDDDITDGDIQYTIVISQAMSADPGYNGLDPADVSVTNLDNEGGPVANDDTAETGESQAVTIDVLGNDSALDLPPYILTIDPGPANGAALVNPDNTITYTPNAGYAGQDSFEYQLCDERKRCDNAVVAITILNRPPAAVDDTYSIDQNSSLSASQDGDPAGVLDNDTDANGDPLSAVLVTGPSKGTLVLERSGSFAYTPEPDFVGEDIFNYQASDGDSQSNVAKVTIEVKDNQPPQLEWISPSENREVFLVGKETIPLQVNASDNIGVSQVKFFRWDPVNENYVDIGTASSAPFQVDLDANELVPGWNQIFARAYDAAGNYSDAEFIWLFHSIRIYLPILFP